MNLQPLFETQKILDQRIIKQHGLEGQDLLPQKILALQVELGECANEWRGFKFWSKDQEPRSRVPEFAAGKEIEYFRCIECKGDFDLIEAAEVDYKCDIDMSALIGTKNLNPLLEEYVDCLHFILSIGLENAEQYGENLPINLIAWNASKEVYKEWNTTLQFSSLFLDIAGLYDATAGGRAYDFQDVEDAYCNIVGSFIGLGELLGFTWEQIEQAYYSKNEINHTRQDTGY